MTFTFETTDTISIALLAAAVLSLILGITVGLRALFTVGLHTAQSDGGGNNEECVPIADGAELPKVSVILSSKDGSETLGRTIDSVMAQDYPDFEIIVVCDATHEATAVLCSRYEECGNIRFTFIPPGSRSLSRRKLANTIGMKAAQGEIALLTSDNIEIPSTRWMRLMAKPFTERHKELTLGYSIPDIGDDRGWGRWYRQFDRITCDCMWIGSALRGKAWRGDRYNMAMRRDTFFAHKGYARSINLHDGDDDLFIDEISTPDNTAVMLDRDAILSTDWGGSSKRAWKARKESREFTSRWLPKGPAVRTGILRICQWISLLCVAALAAREAWISAAAAGLLMLALWSTEIYAYRKAAQRLGAIRLFWSLPLFILWQPVGNFFFRLGHRRRRFKNFTWQRGK